MKTKLCPKGYVIDNKKPMRNQRQVASIILMHDELYITRQILY